VVAAALTGAALAALLVLSTGPVNAQSRTLNVRVGGGSDGNWVNLFLPANITVATGDTLSFRVESGEPHSITFVLGAPPEGGLPVTPSPVTVPDDGPVVNSDLIFGGNPENPPTFDVTFSQAGAYDYFCFIHPFMTGTVTVLDPGDAGSAGIDNQASLDARGAAAENSARIEGEANDAAIRARIPGPVAKPGGTREHSVILGGETRDTQQNIMYPERITVRPGDTVRFVNETVVPHSATIGTMPLGDPFAAPPTANVDPANGVVHTGLIAAEGQPPALTPVSAVVQFSRAGTYPYACLLHPEMIGEVVVSASAPLPPNTGTGALAATSGGRAGFYLVLAVVGMAALATGASLLAAKRG
jgi:plastocyanin